MLPSLDNTAQMGDGQRCSLKKTTDQKKKGLLGIPPKEIYDNVQKTTRECGHYFQISYQKIYELLGPDKVESSAEFLVLMVLVSKLNLYQNHFILNDKKLTPKKLALEIERVAGNRNQCLISYSQVAKIWKSFIERGIIKVDKRGIVSLYFGPSNKENSKNFLKVDISFFHKMIREAQTKNDFIVSFYMFTKFNAYAWRNLRFGHAINSIIDDLGGKIKSDSTLTSSIERIEKKEILLVKRYDTFSKRCNEYVIHPFFSSDLPIKVVDRRIEDQSLTIEAEKSQNQDHNKKSTNIILENPLESTCAEQQEVVSIQEKENPKGVKKVKDSRFNFELVEQYDLSSYSHKNLEKIRSSIKKNPYFRNFNYNHLISEIFSKVEEKGAWPFKEEKGEIKLPLDQYLTIVDKDGSIFEKVLNDYKAELENKKRKAQENTPEAKKQREYQRKVNFLRDYYEEGSLKSELEKIEETAINSLNEFEKEILNHFVPWHEQYQKIQNKINSLLLIAVEERFEELKSEYGNLISTDNKHELKKQIMSICREFGAIGYFDGAISHIEFLQEYMPDMTTSLRKAVLRFLKDRTINNPEFSNIAI